MQGTLPLKSLSETSNIKQEGQLVHLKKKNPELKEKERSYFWNTNMVNTNSKKIKLL